MTALTHLCYHDGMIRTQVQLTEEQFRMLKQVSASTGRSMAEVIREAIDRLGAVGGVDPRARAIAAIGGFHSGSSQVSGSHDDELAEAFAE
jgi:predicted DNA-binding protein